METVAGGGAMTATTVCLACGSHTTVERELAEPELGGASADEIETLVRNEWRGTLEPQAYERRHEARLVRALVAYAVDPESPVRDLIAERRIQLEVLLLGTHGLSHQAIRETFAALSDAARRVLVRGLEPERAAGLADRIDEKVRGTLAA